MPLKPFEIFFPTKGWDTNNVRLAQPDGTSPSLLNIVPFDRWNRRRGGTRFGTSKITRAAMGNGSQPVQLIEQVTRALDPTTISPTAQLLALDYTSVAAGTHVNVDTNLRVTGGYNHGNGNNTVADKLTVVLVGSTTMANANDNASWCNAQYTPTLVLGESYVLQATIQMTATGDPSANKGYRLLFRFAKSGWASGLSLEVTGDKMEFYNNIGAGNSGGTAQATFSFPSTLSVGTHLFELRVNGDMFSGWIDGTQYLAWTSTFNNTEAGVGFGTAGQNGSDGFLTFNVFAGAPLAAYRETSIVSVCGGNIYVGTINGGMILASGGTAQLIETSKPQMASSSGLCWFVDGVHFVQLDLSTKSITAYTVLEPAMGGETADTLGLYTLICVWRDRIVLAASTEFPQNFIMSRQSKYQDWDYSQEDGSAAFAGNATAPTSNNSGAGAVGDPLNCLMPFSDDVLILGGDHTVHKIEGDPAAGGQILLISDSVGTLGSDAWDSDSDGNLYFVGTGGFYRMGSNSNVLENLSKGSVRDYFTKIDRVNQYVTCTWDTDRRGIHIHVTDVNQPSTAPIHLFWDMESGGFFPIQFPQNHGPISAVTYDGDAAGDRALLIGGRDGNIRKLDATVLLDDGATIDSFCFIGPISPYGDVTLGTLQDLSIITGDHNNDTVYAATTFEFDLTIQCGKDALQALYSPTNTVLLASISGQGRQKKFLQRVTGNCFYFKLENSAASKVISLEKLTADIIPAGMVRRY